jgi:membrane-associated phospholipid phosphatase
MKNIQRGFVAGAILFTLAFGSGPAAAREKNDVLAGDIATGLMPIFAFGTAWLKDDTEGEKEWLRSTAADEVIITALRVGFNQTSLGKRPNGNGYGFPSGHAGFLYSQSAFLQYRYGWKYGVPAFVVATAINTIRVREDKHYWRDVIAAGGVSYGISLLFVTPDDATYIAPIVGPDWLGIRFERSF